MRNHSDRRLKPTPILSRYTFFRGRKAASTKRGSASRRLCRPLRSSTLHRADRYCRVKRFRRPFHPHDSGVRGRGAESRGGLGHHPVRNHFIVWKLAVVGFALLLLCLHSKFRLAKAAIAMAVVLYSGCRTLPSGVDLLLHVTSPHTSLTGLLSRWAVLPAIEATEAGNSCRFPLPNRIMHASEGLAGDL